MTLRHLCPLMLSITVTVSPGCTSDIGPGDDNDPTDPTDPTDPVDVPDAGPSTCAETRVDLSAVTPTVMLLVDRSGSMKEDFSGRSRWQAVYDTLMTGSGVVASLESDVRFGMTTYTGADGNCPNLSSIDPALDNFTAIDGLIAPLSPANNTPTGASLQATIPALTAVTEPGPKIIVLATDGEPDTCTVPNPDGTPEAHTESLDAAKAAHAAGIDTYVISVGDAVGQAHLQDMANAGVGLTVGGQDNAPYYQALNTAELVAAFDSIIGGVRSCNFALDRVIDPTYAESGTVTLDGQPLEHGVDWQLLDDGQTLELLGAACDTVLSGDHTVEAEFTCDSGGPTVL